MRQLKPWTWPSCLVSRRRITRGKQSWSLQRVSHGDIRLELAESKTLMGWSVAVEGEGNPDCETR